MTCRFCAVANSMLGGVGIRIIMPFVGISWVIYYPLFQVVPVLSARIRRELSPRMR